MSDDINPALAIDIRGVGKCYQFYRRPADRLFQLLWRSRRKLFQEIEVLKDIDLQVPHGEAVGIVGRNGAGKSTLLQIIAGTLEASTGTVRTSGRIAPLIELGSGFNPEFTGRENIYFNGQLLGMSEREIREKYADIIGFADIGDFIDRPVKTYSSGMYARLAFSVAIHVDPDILIVDEILSVGDLAFQRKCMQRFYDIRDRGCTILYVAHDEYSVRSMCNRCLYLKEGRQVAYGSPAEVIGLYINDVAPKEEPAQDTAPHAFDPVTSHLFRFERLSVLDEDGQPTDVVRHGSKVTLSAEYVALADDLPEEVSFVFNIYSLDGVYVCGSTTVMDGLGTGRPARRGRFSVTFANFPLLTGTYMFRMAINDAQGLLVHLDAKEGPFRVVDEDYVAAGLVNLERSWGIEEVDADAETSADPEEMPADRHAYS